MEKNSLYRVRFAPSPTGHLHIGGLRGALFNYIFAKQNNGFFLIRIEDTDLARSKDEYTLSIIEAFEWCDIRSDEEILFQSKRLEIYNEYIKILLKNDSAYWAVEENELGVNSKVLKCRVNKDIDFIEYDDLIRGKIKFPTSELEDFIIVRSDGSPLYNFVVVVDDIEMNISHIIRGEEHLSNMPKQIILYEALKKNLPFFAHLPLILSPDGKKLSKRDAATAVIDYKYLGFLPQALCAYLIRLGWAYGDQEIFTFEELLKYFDLKKVHKSGAIFDFKKLLSINSIFIKKEKNENLLKFCEDLLKIKNEKFPENLYFEKKIELINLYKDRSDTLLILIENINKVCNINNEINNEIYNENFTEIKNKVFSILNEFTEDIKSISTLNNTELKNIFLKISLKNDIEINVLFKLIRFAILNEISSPSIYKIIEIIEKDELLNRINNFIEIISI